MKKINQTDVMKSLNNLMGRRNLPGGTQEDLQRYCQEAFNYAWRYYPWSFSLKRATIDLTSDGFLPEDFDLDGHFKVAAAPHQPWNYVSIEEYDSLDTGSRYYTLEFDEDEQRYVFITTFAVDEVEIIYQKEPPTLTSNAYVPFPSSLTIGQGATIFAKQADNPASANVAQEWETFHYMLDSHVTQAEVNKPAQVRRTRHDVIGTYPGQGD